MARLLVSQGPRRLGFEEEPDPPLAPSQVRVRTLLSGISAGTELATYRGTSPHVGKLWDPSARLFREAAAGASGYPVRTWGYEQVGEVTEIGAEVSGLAPGALVWGTWGHRTAAVLEDAGAAHRLPDGLEPMDGVFAHVAATALNGVLDAQVHSRETAVVFGLGVLGLIVVQLLRASDAVVFAVDRIPQRLEMARRLGADAALDARERNVAERVRDLTAGRGADVCMEAAGSAAALHEAIRSAAYAARVVSLGFVQGGAGDLFLGEEFHHNRIVLVASQIGAVPPRLSARWSRERLYETVLGLAAARRLRLQELVTHVVPFGDAADAFHLLDTRPEQALQVVLRV